MAFRVEPSEIRDIIPDYDENIPLQPFRKMANALTDRVAAQDSDSVLGTAELAIIEQCLAAHFYESRDHDLSEVKTDNASGVFTGQFGMGLDRTRHGQNAMLFDETGYLRQISKGKVVCSIEWGGKAPDDQVDAVDRGY